MPQFLLDFWFAVLLFPLTGLGDGAQDGIKEDTDADRGPGRPHRPLAYG